jgi:hypothetical protein
MRASRSTSSVIVSTPSSSVGIGVTGLQPSQIGMPSPPWQIVWLAVTNDRTAAQQRVAGVPFGVAVSNATRPSTCGKIRYDNRSDTAVIMTDIRARRSLQVSGVCRVL